MTDPTDGTGRFFCTCGIFPQGGPSVPDPRTSWRHLSHCAHGTEAIRTREEVVHIRALPDDATCHIHDWPTAGLARRLLEAMRERHGKGGVNACVGCIERARDDAKARTSAG